MSSDFVGDAELRRLRTRVAELELYLGVGQQKAWVAERQLWEGSDPFYMCVIDGKVKWTNQIDAALRFARDEDAAAAITTLGSTLRLQGMTRVKEHTWTP